VRACSFHETLMLPEIDSDLLGAILYTYVLYPALIAVMVLLFSRKRPGRMGSSRSSRSSSPCTIEERLPLKLKKPLGA